MLELSLWNEERTIQNETQTRCNTHWNIPNNYHHIESPECTPWKLHLHFLLIVQRTKNKKTKIIQNEEKSHLPLCSDTQMMMNNVKDLHTAKAIVIPSLMRWCVRGAAAVDQ